MIFNREGLLLVGEESERLLFRKVTDADFATWLTFCEEEDALKYIFSKEDQLLTPIQKCEKWYFLLVFPDYFLISCEFYF
jgi:hypothetical protein